MKPGTPKLFAVSLIAAGTILAGCQRQSGPDLKAEVDQLNAQLADLQGKLATAEKTAAAGKEQLARATAEAEASKTSLSVKEHSLGQKEEELRALQTEMSGLKRGDALVFAEASALQKKGSTEAAFDRYQRFVLDFPESALVADANRALTELKPTVEKEVKWRTSLIDPRREEREVMKRFADGTATTQELAPLLRRRTSAEVVTLLGRPGRSFRNGTEMGYVDKVIDTNTGNKETLVIRFEAGRVEGLRAGYQGREVKP